MRKSIYLIGFYSFYITKSIKINNYNNKYMKKDYFIVKK